MANDIQLPLPEGWVSSVEQYTEVDGSEVAHLEAQNNGRFVDIYVGPMPEDETAADQAFSNYAEMVGFADDDEGDPIIQYPFNGRKAYGFEAYDEEDHPLRVLCLEPRKGVLAGMCLSASDEKALENLQTLVERKLRIK